MYRGGSVTEESKNKYISAVVLADQEQAMTEEKVAVSSKVKVLQVLYWLLTGKSVYRPEDKHEEVSKEERCDGRVSKGRNETIGDRSLRGVKGEN